MEIITQIRERLNLKPLPGQEAHFKMAPPMRMDDRLRYVPNEQTKISSVLILLYLHEGKLYFPLIVRPENSGVHSGQVALPGGKKDEEDEDLMATALREAWEEIGVNIHRTDVIGQLSEIYVPPSNFLIYPFIAYIDHQPDFQPSTHEVARLIAVSVDDCLAEENRKNKEITTKYMKAEVPYFDVAQVEIWGATAMILSEFSEIVKECAMNFEV